VTYRNIIDVQKALNNEDVFGKGGIEKRGEINNSISDSNVSQIQFCFDEFSFGDNKQQEEQQQSVHQRLVNYGQNLYVQSLVFCCS
jgi:hypothetical protein